jgi:hypothetical protein
MNQRCWSVLCFNKKIQRRIVISRVQKRRECMMKRGLWRRSGLGDEADEQGNARQQIGNALN